MGAVRRNGAVRAHVLVVDDEPTILMLVEALLRDVADVQGAPTGDEAVRLAGERVPDLILLDSRLPDMTGVQVARLLRASEPTSQTPIVMVTGEIDRNIKSPEITSVLRKPFEVEELRACVRSFLEA